MFRIIVIILVLWLDAFIINGRCALQHCGTSMLEIISVVGQTDQHAILH